jgi:hypothetical protein
MYGYAVGRTLPSTVTYRSHKYVVLQFFHRNGVETAYFAKQEYWPFVKTISGILNQRGTVPNWFQELEKASDNTKITGRRNKVRNWSGLYISPNNNR